ncbi:MAG: hypothetical protein D3914_10620, partial [Candidatus Electrothrix sp. LOE2]|nr:hypothetical protein [Candidatus Electrothrix sp. LOE2]
IRDAPHRFGYDLRCRRSVAERSDQQNKNDHGKSDDQEKGGRAGELSEIEITGFFFPLMMKKILEPIKQGTQIVGKPMDAVFQEITEPFRSPEKNVAAAE